MKRVAIYARKSVFKEDSISIESQIESCKYEARGDDCLIYQDNGFSGKNTERPAFKKMITDIKAGNISKVIVYRLDRISRSVLDFSELMDLFQKYNVDFVSATEHFDTSNPMGRAMLNICVVFAQLERETIQQRVTDAYVSRSQKGFYMGGRLPYGYKKQATVIDGVNTSMYVIDQDEANEIRLIYDLYSKPSATLGDVLRELKSKNLHIKKNGATWCTARLSDTMRNPAYTTNDISIYQFFKSHNSNLINPPEEFDGTKSVYLYSGENTNRKSWDLSGQNIVIAPHKGIVPPDIWITCRKKLLANHQVKTCKPKNSFLAGKIKCGNCGYALVVRISPIKKGSIRYFIDSGWTEIRCCTHKIPAIHADDFEDLIMKKMKEKINTLTIKSKQNTKDEIQEEINKLNIDVEKINSEIEKLIKIITEQNAETVTMNYINKKITELDNQKNNIMLEISNLELKRINKTNNDFKKLENVMDKWKQLDFDDKRSVVELLIKKILVYPEKIEIEWNV